MDNESQQSDPASGDPAAEQALKGAIARALPKESAPAALRQRVLTAIAAEPIGVSSKSISRSPGFRGFVNRIPRGLAAAAVLVLAFSIYWMNRTVNPAVHNTAIPVTLASSMTQRHDTCGLDHDHQMPNVPINDIAALKAQLTKQVPRAAVVTALDAGWTYSGGKLCMVGKIIATHLMFHKDGEELSIFSFKAPEGTENGAYQSQADPTHAIAGYVENEVMICVVVSGSLGKDITEAHRVRQLVSDQCGGPTFPACTTGDSAKTAVTH